MRKETSTEIRVLLVGKTGSGKSSVGNQLIGSKIFKVSRNDGTKKSQLARCTLGDGTELVVVDTPGYCNIHLTEEETQKEVNRGIELLAPGPHVVVNIFSLSERVTGEDIKRLQNFQDVFNSYLQNNTLVVYTGMDEFEDEGQTLEDYIKNLPRQFNDFLIKLRTQPIGVATRTFTDKHSSSKIIQTLKQLYEQSGHSFVETFTSRKGKGAADRISLEASKVVKKGTTTSCNNKRTVVLLGKSGIGKSSLGNVLLGKKVFATSMMEDRGTKTCQIETSDQLVVVDTPGFFTSLRSDVDTAKDILNTLKQNFSSIHVFILVLSVDERFTGSEDKAWEFVTSLFGRDVQEHMMYVFTGKDSLEDDDRQFIFPQYLPRRPYYMLNCKGNNQEDRSDMINEISFSFDNPIPLRRIDSPQLDCIVKTEKRRQKANKVDGEAYRRAVYSRMGSDRPGVLEVIVDCFQRCFAWIRSFFQGR